MEPEKIVHNLNVQLLELYWADHKASVRSPPPVLIDVSGIIKDFQPLYPLSLDFPVKTIDKKLRN